MLPSGEQGELTRWFHDRTGFNEMTAEALYHPVPRRSSIADLLGMFTLMAFVNEIITGVILLFFYHPTASGAWQSVHALEASTFGRFVRALHFWGANAMIVLVGAHLLRVIYVAAYKRPRELQWISGVLMLTLTIGLGFTGYLLPWDQQAYWATMVGTSIPRYVPQLGHYLVRLLRGGEWITGATLSRFYALHVFVFPALLALLLGGHIYLVLANGQSTVERELPRGYRRNHKLGDTGDFPGPEYRPFWPYTVAQMLGGCLVLLAILTWLALHYPAPLLGPADPLNKANYNPLPIWYFFWLYQLLKLTPPALDSVVMIFLPLVGGVLLLALPFLDTSTVFQPRKRPVALSVTGAVTVAVLLLTYTGYISGAPLPPAKAVANPTFTANIEPIFQADCAPCHMTEGIANLSLGSYAGVLKGGFSGRIVKPGDPGASLLIQALEGTAKGIPQMPFGKTPLPKGDIQTISNWIQQGAKNN